MFKEALISEKNEWIRDKLSEVSASESRQFWKSYKILFGEKKTIHIGNLLHNDVLHAAEDEKYEFSFSRHSLILIH